MGQGQEKNAENVLDRFTREGGWAFLQNVHLMQGWLPMLERKLEIAQEIAHEDFRCFVTAEPPGLPDQMLIPEGIMQASIKVANEPPTDVKSLFRGAYALFSQETLDKSTHPIEHRPMLFALSFFHAIVLGRRIRRRRSRQRGSSCLFESPQWALSLFGDQATPSFVRGVLYRFWVSAGG